MFAKIITSLSVFTKRIALLVMTLMMFFIAIAVFYRTFFSPIVGDVEIVRLGMVVLIMFGLAYTQSIGGHISVGLFVDRFSKRVQLGFDVFSSLLTFIVTIIISSIFIGVATTHKYEMPLTTDLLSIPFYPFDYIIVIGFALWGLESLLFLVQSIQQYL